VYAKAVVNSLYLFFGLFLCDAVLALDDDGKKGTMEVEISKKK
jgi:hypothetical protein